jgi:hypothetical protein
LNDKKRRKEQEELYRSLGIAVDAMIDLEREAD